MTNAKNIFSYVLALLSIFSLAGCFEESADDCHGGNSSSKRQVTLRLAAAQSSATRLASGFTRAAWQDTNASNEGEMMRQCFVVVVQNGMIQNIVDADFSESGEKETTEFHTLLNQGEATFYSFANVSRTDVGLDGIGAFPAKIPDDFEGRTLAVDGNASHFDDGIPMSNKQIATIDENTTQIDLKVVRMVAKVKLLFDNQTGYDLKIKSVALSDITSNATVAGADNLMLLPNASGSTLTNIAPTASYADYMVALGGDDGISVANNDEVEAEFYVNESKAHSPKYFVLTIDTNRGMVTKRIAMTKWSEIARNDYLIIPVKLVDFRIAMEAEAFTAIGVTPDVRNDADRITITFGNYGEFHLRTHVYNRNSGNEINGWSIESIATLEAQPEGDEGICVYDEMPTYNASTKLIEGYMSKRSGYAIHELTVKIDGVAYTIPYRIQVVRK